MYYTVYSVVVSHVVSPVGTFRVALVIIVNKHASIGSSPFLITHTCVIDGNLGMLNAFKSELRTLSSTPDAHGIAFPELFQY